MEIWGEFMDISTNYKIVNFNEQHGQLTIKYDVVDHFIHLDLHPDENGLLPEGEELDIYIRGACPTGFVYRKNLFENGVKNLDAIRSLVEPMPEEPSQNSGVNNTMLLTEDVQELIDLIKKQN